MRLLKVMYSNHGGSNVDTNTDATQRVYFRVRYLSPVRGSRTVAWAEKTMNEILILGLKRNQTLEISFVQNIWFLKCNSTELRKECCNIYSGRLLPYSIKSSLPSLILFIDHPHPHSMTCKILRMAINESVWQTWASCKAFTWAPFSSGKWKKHK